MTAPAWLDPTDVANHVGGVDAAPVAELEPYMAAAAAYVQTRRPGLDYSSTDTVPADVKLGTAILTARLWARRGTTLGLANFGEFGPAFIARIDPDIGRLIGLGVHTTPAVG